MIEILYFSDKAQQVIKVYYKGWKGKGTAVGLWGCCWKTLVMTGGDVLSTSGCDRVQWEQRGLVQGEHHIWIWRETTEKEEETKKLRKEETTEGR